MQSGRSARRISRRSRAAVIAGTSGMILVASACSSPTPPAINGDGAEQQAAISSVLEQLGSIGASSDRGDPVHEEHTDNGGSANEDANTGVQDAPPVRFWLPTEPVADPAGWQRSPVECENRDEAIGSSFVSFAAPGDWELGAKGGGSGDPGSMAFDYRYRPADLAEVQIRIESDGRDTNGQLVPYDGQPESESTFDYDYSLDDDTVRITFESLGEVPVGDSTAELFVARPEQAPDRLSAVDYRARVDLMDMPLPMIDGSWTVLPYTFVIEISHLPDKGELPAETVKSIVSSLVMPECSATYAVVLAELTGQRDIDGDGHISDQQDFMDVLQAGG